MTFVCTKNYFSLSAWFQNEMKCRNDSPIYVWWMYYKPSSEKHIQSYYPSVAFIHKIVLKCTYTHTHIHTSVSLSFNYLKSMNEEKLHTWNARKLSKSYYIYANVFFFVRSSSSFWMWCMQPKTFSKLFSWKRATLQTNHTHLHFL